MFRQIASMTKFRALTALYQKYHISSAIIGHRTLGIAKPYIPETIL